MNEDSLFNCRYLLYAKKIVLIDATKYIYRIHKKSVTKKMTIKSYISKLNAFLNIIEIAHKFPNSEFLKRTSIEFIKTWFGCLYNIIRNNDGNIQSLYKMEPQLFNVIKNIKNSSIPLQFRISIFAYKISPKICILLYKIKALLSKQ